ncbi:hypothetical protein FJM67_08170 [Maribrevibacterium harenarium]|uniref:Uncharacterized protein n=1 Tax=Maribrevibacterium harenarium TaxID=2589817 RepID=A0A501WUU5_9GAMM|nr:DEAD/DEAH box helicase [Maribrevibacterium harenarium]TPE51944.1 hypothetical protein FJM67_08170 [Maribrevibacterium harenarium]
MIQGVNSITPSYVEQLINFAPTELITQSGISDLQRDGSVALFNMLVRNGVAYLADEVGMGKTYIGLAVMHLLRYQKPDARVLIITPRRNIQEKWTNDLASFVHQNWLRADHRVKTPQGTPDWPTETPNRLSDWLDNLYDKDMEPHDTILRMTSFSINAKNDDRGKLTGKNWTLPTTSTQKTLIEGIRKLIDKATNYDLIIVDEAHNLKHGYQEGIPSSLRNETLHHLFRPKDKTDQNKPWLLMLSATPMENGDPMSLVRQFEVFGRERDQLRLTDDEDSPIPLHELAGDHSSHHLKDLQRRLIVRRVAELKLPDDSNLTRNMYRREWRKGGVESHEQPLKAASLHERLVNSVIQKNVFEMLQRDKGGKYRIGALESFEIYAGAESSLSETDDGIDQVGLVLPDQRLIADLCQSYRNTFSAEVPHPKLNAVAKMLSEKVAQREKALVFVRRVATTTDLASRVSAAFDQEIIARIKSAIVHDEASIVDKIAQVWTKKRASREYAEFEETTERQELQDPSMEEEKQNEESNEVVSEVVPSLFTWWFRGARTNQKEYAHLFTGRYLREQLEASSKLSLLLEENYVDWVLLRPQNCLAQLAHDSTSSEMDVISGIAKYLPIELSTGTIKNYRRTFHHVQLATLRWMLEQPCYSTLHDNLRILVDEIFDNPGLIKNTASSISGKLIREMLAIQGIYPSLARSKEPEVSRAVARGVFEAQGEAATFDFRLALRQREQIRHMQTATLRNGAPLIDLYLACLKTQKRSIMLNGNLSPNRVAKTLVSEWDKWARTPEASLNCGLSELIEIKQNFDLIRKLNFPTIDVVQQTTRALDRPLLEGQEPYSDSKGNIRSVRRFLTQEFSGQAPTAAAQGGQKDERRHRITTHFRMPGMPWVVVATNVYEEGVDLHTFCKTVIHHGISHTASSVEQRTGRVDRIGGLFQRDVASMKNISEFVDERKIQSLFPYQNDTFEKFQVRRVLLNCNRMVQRLHDTDKPIEEDKEAFISDRFDVPKQITQRLSSPFDVKESEWLRGELAEPDRKSDFCTAKYLSELKLLESKLEKTYSPFEDSRGQGIERHYNIADSKLFVRPKSDRLGDSLLVDINLVQKDGVQKAKIIHSNANGEGWCDSALKAINDLFSEHH